VKGFFSFVKYIVDIFVANNRQFSSAESEPGEKLGQSYERNDLASRLRFREGASATEIKNEATNNSGYAYRFSCTFGIFFAAIMVLRDKA